MAQVTSGEGSDRSRGRPRPSPAGAVLLALGVVVLAAVSFLWIPHWILSGLPFGSRSMKVGLATGWVGAAFLLASFLAWRTSHPGSVGDREVEG